MFNKFKSHIRDQCYYLEKSLREHWLHAILGITAIFEGVTLIVNNTYFIYPPYLQQEMNNDIVGVIAIILGCQLIRWCIDGNRTLSQNGRLLVFSSAFFAFMTVAEIVQMFAPNFSPHVIVASITNCALLVITYCLASVHNEK